MIWNPGDGTDLMEGGDGNGHRRVNGGQRRRSVHDHLPTATRVRFDRISPLRSRLISEPPKIWWLNANGGDDVITAGNGLASLIKLTIDGARATTPSPAVNGNDMLIGGDGNDASSPAGRGNEHAQLGSGNDTFVWNPGDGQRCGRRLAAAWIRCS